MPPPILSRVPRAGALLPAGVQAVGYCGAFTYIDDWAVTNRIAGVIVQKITRAVTVTLTTGGLDLSLTVQEMAGAFDPDNTALCLDTLTYWELFPVAASGVIHGDQFQSNWFAKTNKGQPVVTTAGVYTITGEASFYATQSSPASLGFPGSIAIAAGLPSTTNDPTSALAALPKSNTVTRTVTASWNHRVQDRATMSYGLTQLAIA
jgi:hypothetical protein